MALLKAANVEEYRQMYGEALAEREKELGKEITDEMLTEAIYKKLSGKADIDYYAFYKAFNPKGKYSNLATYRT